MPRLCLGSILRKIHFIWDTLVFPYVYDSLQTICQERALPIATANSNTKAEESQTIIEQKYINKAPNSSCHRVSLPAVNSRPIARDVFFLSSDQQEGKSAQDSTFFLVLFFRHRKQKRYSVWTRDRTQANKAIKNEGYPGFRKSGPH